MGDALGAARLAWEGLLILRMAGLKRVVFSLSLGPEAVPWRDERGREGGTPRERGGEMMGDCACRLVRFDHYLTTRLTRLTTI